MPATREVIKHYIDSINEEGRGLSPWEVQFVEGISDRFERGGGLSEKEETILERIYSERTP